MATGGCGAPFESFSIGLCAEISKFSVDSLNTINKMDKHSMRISKSVDKILRNIHNDDFMKSAKNINKLRKLLEIVATRKFQLAVKNYDFIDQNIKSLDAEIQLLEKALERGGNSTDELKGIISKTPIGADGMAPPVKQRGFKRKNQLGDASLSTNIDDAAALQQLQQAPTFQVVPSSEPVYCVCKRIAFGDMVACDNDECPIEWFHYTCVSLTKKPKNSWLCPSCSSTKKFKK